MYTSFINEPSEIRGYDLRCHIDVQPEAVLLLQWIGNWLRGFFNHYLSSRKNLDKHTRATVRSDCTWFPQLSATTKAVDAIDQSNLCFWSVSEGGQFVIQMEKKRTDPLLNVKTSQPVMAVRLTDGSFKTRRQTTTAPKLLMPQRRW